MSINGFNHYKHLQNLGDYRIMSKITISNLQTEENLLVELQPIEANFVVGGSDKGGRKEGGYGKEYGDDDDDKYGRGGREGDDDNEYGRRGGYRSPKYHPPVHFKSYRY
jgi:hypothetical protein